MSVFFKNLSYVTIGLSAFLLSYLMYLSFYPFSIVKLHSFNIETPVVKRGEIFTYTLDFEKLKPFRADIRYYLVDGIIIQLEPSGTSKPIGDQTVKLNRIVPTTILPGVYKLRIELDYKITAWRTVSYVWESDTFTVL